MITWLYISSNGVRLYCFQDSGHSMGSLSRDFTLSRVVFSSMQAVASTPVHKPIKKLQCQTGGVQNTSKPSRFQQFHEVKKKKNLPITSKYACLLIHTLQDFRCWF